MSEVDSDEAVRRLREESRLRIEAQNRRRSFAGWCAIATLASGISLAPLDAHEAKVEAEDVARREAPAQAAVDVDPRFLEEEEEEVQALYRRAHTAALRADAQ